MLERVEKMDRRRAVVLLSSGLDIGEFTEHTYLELLDKTQSVSFPIYTISTAHLGVTLIDTTTTGGGITGTRIPQADNAMRSFADNSGGSTFTPRFVEDFPSLLHALSSQLRYAYRVSFVPSNRKPDGKFHKLRVEVDTHGKADKPQIHYKKGYYAPK
jgi:VWFA-related protein